MVLYWGCNFALDETIQLPHLMHKLQLFFFVYYQFWIANSLTTTSTFSAILIVNMLPHALISYRNTYLTDLSNRISSWTLAST